MKLLWILLLTATLAQAAPEAAIPEAHRAFFKQYCTGCHNEEKQKGKVRLDDLPFQIANVNTADRWQKVLAVLNSGEMPPEDEKQPLPAEKLSLLEALSQQMVVARKTLADTGKPAPIRRLNRREYVHTIRELLGVEVDPISLPADDDNGFFDTVGSNLFFSSDQLERYLELGRAALDNALVTGAAPAQRIKRVEPEIEANLRHRQRLEPALEKKSRLDRWKASGGRPAPEFGFDDAGVAIRVGMLLSTELPRVQSYLADPFNASGVMLQNAQWWPQTLDTIGLPPGHYRVRVRLGFDPNMSPRERVIEYGYPGEFGWPAEMKLLGWRAVTGTFDAPEILEIPLEIRKGGPRFFGIREKRPNNSEFTSLESQRRRQIKPDDDYLRTLWIDWFEWEGPVTEQWPPRSHSLALAGVDIGNKPGETEAREVITQFARRAFRGQPVAPAYVDRLMAHFNEQRRSAPFLDAIKTPLSIVLASPSFLYLAMGEEPDAAPSQAKHTPLSEIELANRLSYFLWSGPPDDQLLALAHQQRLRQPEVLASEVNRMLAHARFRHFLSGFTHQWLHMVRLDFFRFNPRLFPLFDDTVKNSARQEVYETLRHVLENNLPIQTLLKSDFVVINRPLADYYGLSGVPPEGFHRVDVPREMPRGGLLGMAAILAMGSDGNRSSPVERGAWVLRKLLHLPPPPAPANIPQLSRFSGELMPARKLMLAHQEQPQCAHCHRNIDPIGYGLERFDATGSWREEELTEITKLNRVVKTKTFPIDTTGSLPDGTQFKDFFDLREAIAAQSAAFTRGLAENLFEYALGRPCGFTDQEKIDAILQQSKKKGQTLRALLVALVESSAFQSR